MTSRLFVHTDGASRGNPGPAGAGVVIKDESGATISSLVYYLGITTNNQAEYRAVIAGLEAASKFKPQHVDLYVDSELIARQLRGVYQVKNAGLQPLYRRSIELLRGFTSFDVHHVRREQNRDADALANRAIDQRRFS